jgi:type I restriction enzyme, S subunit
MSYPTYQSSSLCRFPDVGEIPKNWEARRLKFAASLRNEKIDADEADLEYIGLEHIESWTGKRIEDGTAFSEGVATRFLKNDVLFGKLRPYLAKVYLADKEGMATTEALVLVTEEVLEPAFLKYLLLSERFIDAVSGTTYGAKMPRANWDSIGGLPILLPSKEEQQKISDFLDWKTGQIDALIAKKKQLIEKLQEKRIALITQAVTKGLNPNAPMRDSGIRWLGEVPEHWNVCRVKFAAEMDSGHTPSRSQPDYWIEEECVIPWVSLNDTKHLRENDFIYDTAIKISAYGMKNSSAHLIPANSVIFTRDATIGLTAITRRPMAVSQHIIAWTPTEFLKANYLLRSFLAMNQELESFTLGSTLKTIGMPDVKKLAIALPPLPEQAAIADYLDAETNRIDLIVDRLEAAINHLTEYRTALITAATTGKIDVRNVKLGPTA